MTLDKPNFATIKLNDRKNKDRTYELAPKLVWSMHQARKNLILT